MSRPELSPDIIEAIRPVSVSSEHVLTVPEAFGPLFPLGGLQRGWSVGVHGSGGWLVASALLASALGGEEWVAVVGGEHLNLDAAADLGLRLDRMVVVESPPSTMLGTVVAALMEAVQAVVISPTTMVGVRDARRLGAKLREHRGTLWHLDGGERWPDRLDLTLEARTTSWSGLGVGHGCLTDRCLTVTSDGRRSASRPSQVQLVITDDGFETAPDLATVTPLRLDRHV